MGVVTPDRVTAIANVSAFSRTFSISEAISGVCRTRRQATSCSVKPASSTAICNIRVVIRSKSSAASPMPKWACKRVASASASQEAM
jgi:hypothetical protein